MLSFLDDVIILDVSVYVINAKNFHKMLKSLLQILDMPLEC